VTENVLTLQFTSITREGI